MSIHRLFALALAAVSIGGAASAAAQPLSLEDSFRIGTGGSALCTAQLGITDPAAVDMFDRAYAIVCRDASVEVGRLFALRTRGSDPAARLAELRAAQVECAPAESREVEDLGAVDVATCRRRDADLQYYVYSWNRGDTLYVAEGLAGYDSALRLGLRTLVADRPVPGEVSVALTGVGDAADFARVQAGTLDPRQALNEAYRRNNAGRFAESAAFFADLLRRGSPETQAEALVNRALQQSNLGEYAEAESLFASAERSAGDDPVMARMLRNYRAIHYLNRRRPSQALAELDRLPPEPMRAPVQSATLVIDAETAARLNSESGVARQLDAASNALLPEERVQILDGQADQLRGTVHRLQGRTDGAIAAINSAVARLEAIRGGRVRSTLWMRAQLLSELASIAEERGDRAEAERQHQAAVALIGEGYPESFALLNAQARLAGFYARTGQVDPALALYGSIVDANAESGGNSASLRRSLTPYFSLLVQQSTPEAVAAMFKASQVLVRPGVAQTQAVLARELSGGSDEAARLFRQSVTLSRDIERARVELARLETVEAPTDADRARAAAVRDQLAELEEEQTATQSRLADFPRYRVVSGNAITLAELQQLLQPGEAYYKMLTSNGDAYGIFVTRETARAFRLGVTPAELDREVDALRATISVVQDNQNLTYPFDLELAYRMYQQLFGPVSAELAQVRHLVFEPDGAMLRLPPNLLVMDRAAIDAYAARTANPDADAFDFRGIEWLGRQRDVSTSVSARAFRDGRQARASDARSEYIGFGENQPVSAFAETATTGTRNVPGGADCAWPLFAWNRPISAGELLTARQSFSANGDGDAEVITGAEFSDTSIKRRDDLDEFRILHFATHGLVTGPRPQCPAQPALMTSFGGEESDGLLTFSEIYDLRLDADLVILSACDTAGHGSRAAAEAAGVSGGDYALDGLVRAFVGAGGRMVIASHWPVPVDFDATQRLISGLFTAPPGTGTAAALRQAELALMERPETSHPYYWAGFAVVGDGAVPVIRSEESASSGGN